MSKKSVATAPTGPDADVLTLAADADAAAAGRAPGADDPAPGDAPREEKPAEPATREMLAGLLRALIAKATKRFPSLANVWTVDDVETFSMALAPLLDKYGLTPSWLKAWEIEITALMICGPLIAATVIAVRADLEAERARAAKPAGSGSTATAADDGTVKPKPTGE